MQPSLMFLSKARANLSGMWIMFLVLPFSVGSWPYLQILDLAVDLPEMNTLDYLNGASAEKNVFQILSPRASTANL